LGEFEATGLMGATFIRSKPQKAAGKLQSAERCRVIPSPIQQNT